MLLSLFLVASLSAQSPRSPWRVSFSAAWQQQDRRTFNLPKYRVEYMLTDEAEATRQFSFGLHRRLWQNQRLRLDLGLAYSRETNRFRRDIDIHFFLNPPPPPPGVSVANGSIINYSESYQVHQILLPAELRLHLWDMGSAGEFFASGTLLPALHFLKSHTGEASAFRGSYGKMSRYTWNFYSVEFNPGLGLALHGFEVQLSYRLAQIRRWDPIIGSRYWGNTTDEPVDTYNPFKLWLSLSYDLDFKRWFGKK